MSSQNDAYNKMGNDYERSSINSIQVNEAMPVREVDNRNFNSNNQAIQYQRNQNQQIEKRYSSGTFDCCSDISSCCCVLFCHYCAVCDIAEKIGANDTHGCDAVCFSICCGQSLYALCCCPRKSWKCFISDLLDKSMARHGINVHPGPCGKDKCCCEPWWCYCNVWCCEPCILCLMLREAKTLRR